MVTETLTYQYDLIYLITNTFFPHLIYKVHNYCAHSLQIFLSGHQMWWFGCLLENLTLKSMYFDQFFLTLDFNVISLVIIYFISKWYVHCPCTSTDKFCQLCLISQKLNIDTSIATSGISTKNLEGPGDFHPWFTAPKNVNLLPWMSVLDSDLTLELYRIKPGQLLWFDQPAPSVIWPDVLVTNGWSAGQLVRGLGDVTLGQING